MTEDRMVLGKVVEIEEPAVGQSNARYPSSVSRYFQS